MFLSLQSIYYVHCIVSVLQLSITFHIFGFRSFDLRYVLTCNENACSFVLKKSFQYADGRGSEVVFFICVVYMHVCFLCEQSAAAQARVATYGSCCLSKQNKTKKMAISVSLIIIIIVMKCFESFAKSIQQQIVVHFCSIMWSTMCVFFAIS